MKKFKTKQGISLLLVLVMLLSPVLQLRAVAAEPVTEQDSVRAGDRILWESDTGEPFAVEMQVDSRWGTSYHATFTIRNTGDKVIDNWYLEFASDDVIENIWNASVLQNEDGVYLVRNAQWNQDIAVGGSVSFGFTACCGRGISLPDSFRMPTAKLPVEETAWSCEYSVANEQQSSFYNASFVIRNNREEAIEDWIVEFDFAGTIDNIWNAEIISREGDHYVIRNAGYNQNIAGQGMVTFGFNGEKQEGESPTPGEIRLYQITYCSVPGGETGGLSGEEVPGSTVSGGDVSGGDVSGGDGPGEDVSGGDVPPEDLDSDGDGIPDAVEMELGFDPYAADSDGDGLPDGYELYTLYPLLLYAGLDESLGINAGDDYDGDLLTNLEEYLAGTNPGNQDTDGDGLGDYDEMVNRHTDPALYDTDGDGLNDGLEAGQGLDPLQADSDGDGIPDGEEILCQRLTAGENAAETAGTVPELVITGSGDYSRKLEIVDVSCNAKFGNTGFLVGQPYDFRHEEEIAFEEAVLTFRLSGETLLENNIVDLAIAWYDEDNNVVELLDTSYDKRNSTISAEVEHFSIYMVVNRKAYYNNLNTSMASVSPEGEEFNGHTYVLIDEGMPWTEAVAYCAGLGGYPAIIESEKEQEFLTDLLKREGTMNTYFIGLSGTDNQYSWLNGHPLSYTNWGTGEPNNTTETVVHMYGKQYGNFPVGKWNDTYNYCDGGSTFFHSTRNCGILCEIPGSPEGSCIVVLSDGSVVALDADPHLGDETVDTDGDGLPDLVELGQETDCTIPESYGLYGQSLGERTVRVWSFRSNPAVADTDGDGFTDGNDGNPLTYDITVTEVYGNNVVELNTGAVYCIFGWDIREFYEQYHIRSIHPMEIDMLESLKRQLDMNRERDYSVEEAAFLYNIDPNGIVGYMAGRDSLYKREVCEVLTGVPFTERMAEEFFAIPTADDAWERYEEVAYTQIILGKYAEEQNLLGTLGELGVAFTGADVLQDIRDLSYDVTHWESGWEHLGETFLDGIGLFPIVGFLGKTDELVALCKRSDNLIEIRRLKSLEQVITGLDGMKYVNRVQEYANAAGRMMEEFGASLYRCILNTCEGTGGYRAAYAMAGGYSNDVIEALYTRADDLADLYRQDRSLVENVVREVAESGGKNADELEELVSEAVDDAMRHADDIGEVGTDALKFNNWDDMKDAFKGTITQFVKENKPKYSPNIKKWFDNGGSIEIQYIDGKQIWTYTSAAGNSVPYIDGYIKFPDEYLNPTIKFVDIGEFTGDRANDIDKMLEILEEDYGITEIPEGYVVHHDIENGILQLVDENIHTEFTHIGGYSIYN